MAKADWRANGVIVVVTLDGRCGYSASVRKENVSEGITTLGFPPSWSATASAILRAGRGDTITSGKGGYAKVMAGAYYAKQLIEARQQGRLGRIAADLLMTIRAIWDIGGTGAKADACSIWTKQWIGREIRVLNYCEAKGQPLATHVAWLREHGYPVYAAAMLATVSATVAAGTITTREQIDAAFSG